MAARETRLGPVQISQTLWPRRRSSAGAPTPVQATLQERGRFRQVDALRGIAAFSVLFYHVAFRFPQPRTQLMQYLTQRNSGPPAVCLVIFFAISGFVIYRPFVAARWDGKPMPPLLPYAVRRFVRIVPAYWLALAVAGVWMSLPYLFTPTGFIRYFGFLQLYGNHSQVGGGIAVAWSLGVEMTFYASLPLLALAARRLGPRFGRMRSELVVLAGMVLTTVSFEIIVCQSIPRSNTWLLSVLDFLPGTLDFFAAGMLIAVLSVDVERRQTLPGWWRLIDRCAWLPWLLGLGLLAFQGQLAAHIWTGISFTGWWVAQHELKPIAAFLLILPLAFGSNRGLIRRVMGTPVLVYIGTVSYGFYLWHYQILLQLQKHLIPHGELITTVVVAALAYAAGSLSWFLLERPAMELTRRWLKARAIRQGRGTIGPLISSATPAPPDPRT